VHQDDGVQDDGVLDSVQDRSANSPRHENNKSKSSADCIDHGASIVMSNRIIYIVSITQDVSTGARAWQAGAQVCGQWQGHIPTPVQSGCAGVQGGRERPSLWEAEGQSPQEELA